MARKSKETMLAEKAKREQITSVYRAVAYIRLSTEDFRHKTNVNNNDNSFFIRLPPFTVSKQFYQNNLFILSTNKKQVFH